MSETNDNPARSLPPFAELRVNEFEMYDHLPYHKDIYLCTPEMIKTVTGNVVKYYTVQEDESLTIDTNDLAKHLVECGKEESRRFHSHDIPDPDNVIDTVALHEEDVTPADAAPASAGKAAKTKAAEPEPKKITNAFAGFEDEDENDDDFSFLRGGN